MAFQYPEQFGSVGAFGAGIFDKELAKFTDWIKVTSPEQRPRVLIDIGNQDTSMMEFAHVLTQTLTQQDVPYQLIIEPGQHNYQYWASHLERYYLWFAEDW